MRFDRGIDKKYRKSVEDAFDAIMEHGNDMHRHIARHILKSDMLVRVRPVSEINASGITGLIDRDATNEKIADERIGLREALGEVYIAIAKETIDTGGQRGCEGTFVHEGRHAYDFALTIASYSDADVNPLSVFDPTLYELELEKRRAETADLEANKMDISFGSQIRNYVLHPYRLVKDTRTKFELTDVDAVLDGEIDEFIKEFLLFKKTGKTVSTNN